VYAYYDEKTEPHSIFNPFSITKSFITTLTGIALREGRIESLDDRVQKYLPEFADSDVGQVKLRQLLKHCSGIRFAENNLNPFAGNAKYYYGGHLRKYLRKLRLYTEPGCEYNYSSANTQLLGMAIERAVGMTLSAYLQDRLWSRIGMEYDAEWSMDGKHDEAMEKAFSGLNATGIDLAKLGRLYLHRGVYGGESILQPSFVDEALTRDISEGSRWDYQYNFGVGPKEYGTYYAVGLYGQLVYVYPEKDVIIVRLVHSSTSYNPPFVYHNMLQIIDQL
jgi:CubicO group peptidase (beta-lactamase class C family)